MSKPYRIIIDSEGRPVRVKPFSAINSTDVDGTTARTVKAAVTGKRLWISGIRATNKTAGENPVVLIKDTDGTPKLLAVLQPGALADVGAGDHQDYDPPLEVGSGLGITAEATSAVGDTLVHITGWVEA